MLYRRETSYRNAYSARLSRYVQNLGREGSDALTARAKGRDRGAQETRDRLSFRHTQPATDRRRLFAAHWLGRWRRRVLPTEAQGVRDIERIFGVTPSCYGQPGAAWASQTFPALK